MPTRYIVFALVQWGIVHMLAIIVEDDPHERMMAAPLNGNRDFSLLK